MKAGYPIWWDSTITLYNNYKDPETQKETWYKTSLNDCFWKDVGQELKTSNEVLVSNSIICRIPCNENFMPKSDWDALEDKTGKFTISTKDIIVFGEADDVINDYVSGQRSTDLLKKYKAMHGCMEVESFSINTHTGANNPHYLVRGS